MWPHQAQFLAFQKDAARDILSRVDDRLEPEVFLAGLLDEDDPGKPRACVEPGKDFWISDDAFNQTRRLAATMLPTYPEARIVRSGGTAMAAKDDVLHRRSLRDAIILTIQQNHHGQPKYFFASFPEKINGYLVSIAVGLSRSAVSAQRHLKRARTQMQKFGDASTAVSFIDSVIEEFLSDAADQLRKTEPGRFHARRDADELLRSAGKKFAADVAFRADPSASEGYQGFFASCNLISSIDYERTEGRGKMVIARSDHPALLPVVRFMVDSRLDQFRGSRKMLELATRGLALHTNSRTVFGLVECKRLEIETEDLFEVEFLGHDRWELCYNGQVMMRVRFGQPYLPRRSDYEARLKWDLPRIFKGVRKEDVELFTSLVRAAEEERHGTMLVISASAASEARRLASQCIMVEPTQLSAPLMPNLTPIDGAVLVDPRGFCHAIGVILDGVASGVGDPSRGARFNSAIRYAASSRAPCLAVVVSEDGGVDLVPELPPPIRRSSVDAAIRELSSCAVEVHVPGRRYLEAFDWLCGHRFYLLEKDCMVVNEFVRVIEKRLNEEDPSRMQIARTPFRPNPQMKESLYYEENLEEPS